jgi:ATP-dependent helicase/nuclease subunit B
LIRLSDDLFDLVQAGGTLIVPSRQRAHAAQLAFAAMQLARGLRVWATPDILPVEAWLIRETERLATASNARLPRVLSPAEDWLLWRQCTAEATRDIELLNRASLAESLRRASALAAEYGIDVSELPSFAGTEAELFHKTQKAVAGRYQALNASNIQSLVAPGPGRPVTCAGFLQLSPRLRATGAAQRSVSSQGVRPVIVVAADESNELERIAAWCKRQIASVADTRLLVILPGSPGARERLATLIRQAVDPAGWLSASGDAASNLVAIEGGAPLAEVPVVAHALSTLRWLGGSTGEFNEIGEWLRAPYWDTPNAGLRARLDLWLREIGKMSISGREWNLILGDAPAPLAPGAQELARQIDAATQALAGGVVSPREWSERFRAALAAVHWPGERVRDSSEQQTVVRLHELLDEFGQLSSSARAMSREEAIHWFGEFAARTAFRPADDDAVVTISPTLADPVVLYDGIWVAGMHAEAFPQPVQPDPFLPLSAQLAAGVPTASAGGRLAEAEALLSAWRAATDELVLSRPARAEDLELLPSPLLTGWLGIGGEAGAVDIDEPRALKVEPWLAQRIHRPNMVESFEDSVGVPWPLRHTLPAGTRSLELQNLCSFRAYAELRLGTSDLDAPEPGVPAPVRGQLLHAALQFLWRQLRDSTTLVARTESELDVLIERCVAEAADAILGRAINGDRAPVFARECRRTMRLIKRLCALERGRASFQVEDTEFERTLTVSGAQMRVRIDRLDALGTGGHAILDYKSGRRTTADWYGERPSHPQLLAYLAAIGEGVVAMATVNVTAREVRFDGIASSSQLLPKVREVAGPIGMDSGEAWKLRTREWRARVEHLASAFLAGNAVVDPKPGACDFCHAVGLCRISDRGIDVAAELLPIEFESGNE